MIILRYHEIFFRLTGPRSPVMAAGAVSLRKSHDIVILSFCNLVKGQAKYSIGLYKYSRPIMGLRSDDLALMNNEYKEYIQ